MNRIEDWAKAIQKHEGWFPGSASQRNNNPGNFRCSSLVMGEFGATKCVNNLAVFPTYEKGWEALKQFLIYACTDQLKSYKSTMTLLEFYGKYAPSSDNNNPLNYASAVAKDLGVGIDTKIKDLYAPSAIPEATEDFDEKLYFQRSSRYKGKKIGKSNTPMQTYGCLLCCLSYISRKDPLDVNQLFIDKGVYTGDMINLGKACEVLGFKNYLKTKDINYMPKQEETIKEVRLGRGVHFVVRFNKNGKRWIYCPWLGKIMPINHYDFLSYRVFDR